MRRARGALVSGLAVAGAVGGMRLGRFYQSLAPETGEDERLFANCENGWRVALYRYQGRSPVKATPVVLAHGFAGSRLIWDLVPETSLARHLAAAGYDVYALDWRGRGESWPIGGPDPTAQWSFDDFVFQDLPAALELACRRSGSEQAFWLGLEMSGQALYAAAISGTATRVRGGVTFGSPVWTPASAKVPGVTAAPRGRRGGRVRFRSGAHHAGPILALLHSRELESSFRPANVDPIIPARYLRSGVPDEASVLADQFADWIEHDTMRSLDHEVIWSDRLEEVRLPLLVMAAAADLQRPAAATQATYEALGSKDKTYFEAGKDSGCSVDFGHDDLVSGRAAPAEVFPKIVAWLDAHLEDSGQDEGERSPGCAPPTPNAGENLGDG